MLAVLATARPGAAADSTAGAPAREPYLVVEGLEANPPLQEAVLLQARLALYQVRRHYEFEIPETIRVAWTPEEDFRSLTGFHPENSAAAAAPAEGIVYVNEAAWRRSDPNQQIQTMRHELGHVLLHQLPGGNDLPLWANEGIVMHLAGQWSGDDHLKLLSAYMFGQLPSLRDLEKSFPRDGESQTLAYRFSYSAVAAVAGGYGDDPGSVRRLLMRLADDRMGPALQDEFWDAFRIEGWQRATERSLGSRMSASIIVLTSTGSIFLLITILFLVAVWRRRADRTAREKEWEEDQDGAWRSSLSEADVQDIYGDREERWKGADDDDDGEAWKR